MRSGSFWGKTPQVLPGGNLVFIYSKDAIPKLALDVERRRRTSTTSAADAEGGAEAPSSGGRQVLELHHTTARQRGVAGDHSRAAFEHVPSRVLFHIGVFRRQAIDGNDHLIAALCQA